MCDRHAMAMALWGLGLVAHLQGSDAAAHSFYEESLAIRKALGDRRGIALSLWGLGYIALGQGEYAAARAMQTQSLTIRRELGDRRGIAESLEALAAIDAAEGRVHRAGRLFAAAAALRDRIGAPLPPAQRPHQERSLAEVRASLGEVTLAAVWAEGRAMAQERAIHYALENRDTSSDEAA